MPAVSLRGTVTCDTFLRCGLEQLPYLPSDQGERGLASTSSLPARRTPASDVVTLKRYFCSWLASSPPGMTSDET